MCKYQRRPGDDADPLNSFVTRSLLEAYTTSDLIESVAKGQAASAAKYPNTKLGQRLETISGMIKANYGTHVYYAMQPGYDHTRWSITHPCGVLLRNLGNSLKTFHG